MWSNENCLKFHDYCAMILIKSPLIKQLLMKKTLPRALVLATLFAGYFLSTCFSQPAPNKSVVKVSLVSRLEFAPELLDLIRNSLSQKLGAPCTLFFQPIEDIASFSPDNNLNQILVESGIPENVLPPGFYKGNDHIDLVWLLSVSGNASAKIKGESLNTREFVELLAELKTRNPHKFPWFEPLCSKVTLRNFFRLFSETLDAEPHKKSPVKPLWLENHAIAFLYRAIESEYLNPWSVEADAAMAASVFAAGDADFSTCWIPLEYLLQQQNREEKPGKTLFIPFPASDGGGLIPRIRLNLWERQPLERTENKIDSPGLPVASYSFIDLEYVEDMDWIKKNFSNKYDSLIMGDF